MKHFLYLTLAFKVEHIEMEEEDSHTNPDILCAVEEEAIIDFSNILQYTVDHTLEMLNQKANSLGSKRLN